MHEFFTGWQRKTGCGTLLLACVVMAAWGRSFVSEDEVWLPAGGAFQYRAKLVPSGIEFGTFDEMVVYKNKDLIVSKSSRDFIAVPASRSDLDAAAMKELLHNARPHNVDFESMTEIARYPTPLAGSMIVPYWIVAFPLTLLSAYLLLRKPRNHAADSISPETEKRPSTNQPSPHLRSSIVTKMLLVVACFVLLFGYYLSSVPRATSIFDFHRIQPGMSEEEVLNILGAPYVSQTFSDGDKCWQYCDLTERWYLTGSLCISIKNGKVEQTWLQ